MSPTPDPLTAPSPALVADLHCLFAVSEGGRGNFGCIQSGTLCIYSILVYAVPSPRSQPSSWQSQPGSWPYFERDLDPFCDPRIAAVTMASMCGPSKGVSAVQTGAAASLLRGWVPTTPFCIAVRALRSASPGVMTGDCSNQAHDGRLNSCLPDACYVRQRCAMFFLRLSTCGALRMPHPKTVF